MTTTTTTHFPYTLVDSSLSLSACVDVIRAQLARCASEERRAYLYLDCEGRDLGRVGGRLGLLQLGIRVSRENLPTTPSRSVTTSTTTTTTCRAVGDDVEGKNGEEEDEVMVFLIDTVSQSRESLSPIYALLTDPGVVKVLWDGRMDQAQLVRTESCALQGTLDLQVVEVFRRIVASRGEHQGGGGGEGSDEVYALLGLRPASLGESLFSAAEMQEVDGVDGVVRGYHRAAMSAHWLCRPMEGAMLTYAALDIYSLARLHALYARRGWCGSDGDDDDKDDDKDEKEEALLAMSARYCALYASGALRDARDRFAYHGYLPLGVLDQVETSAPQGEVRWVCAGCRRTLLARLFHRNTAKRASPDTRFCPVCQKIRNRDKYRIERK